MSYYQELADKLKSRPKTDNELIDKVLACATRISYSIEEYQIVAAARGWLVRASQLPSQASLPAWAEVPEDSQPEDQMEE